MITDFSNLSEKELKYYSDLMFQPLSSAKEVSDWLMFFLGLDIPMEITDPESTSTPLDAIWQIYKVFKENSGDKTPGAIMLSAREGMKTVSISMLEILLLLHFQLDIAHGSATESQSSVCIKYIENFLFKLEPLIKQRGWENTTSNKRTIQYRTPDGKTPYIKVLICTPKGMNSLHANFLALDELDLADPAALKEARNIVGYSKGIYGMTVYLSTRKYAFGNMNEALEKADEMGYKVLRWNITDLAERCPETRHLPKEPKQDRYVAKNLPLLQISPEEYSALPPTEQIKYDLIQKVHAGCLKCPLLPVCRMRLANKLESASGGFYKPISAVIQKFRENDPDTAEAQLMCWRPSSAGLVYGRFSKDKAKGNVISVADAYTSLTGKVNAHVSHDTLIKVIKKLDIPLYAGVDWGFTHDTVIVIMAKLPNDEIWGIDCFAAPGLEFTDVLEAAMKFRDQYGVQKWFCDQAMPSHIKSFNKNGMKSPSFTKDVIGGIEAVRSKIVNASGKRLFKVLDTFNNKKVIDSLSKHRFLLDAAGNPTPKPGDEPSISDVADAIRYVGQNLFPVRGTQKPMAMWTETEKAVNRNPTHTQQMMGEIAKHVSESTMIKGTSAKKGGFFFSS